MMRDDVEILILNDQFLNSHNFGSERFHELEGVPETNNNHDKVVQNRSHAKFAGLRTMFKVAILVCMVIGAIYCREVIRSAGDTEFVEAVKPHSLQATAGKGGAYGKFDGGKYAGKSSSSSSKYYDYTAWIPKEDTSTAAPKSVRPATNSALISTTVSPTVDQFWGDYGEKIQEAFILSKYDLVKDDADVPPGFWTAFTKNIGYVLDTASMRAQQIANEGQLRTDVESPTYQKVPSKKYSLKASSPDASADSTTTAPLVGPALYWKQFGVKIGESFNKTKNATTTGDSTSPTTGEQPTPIIPGAAIGKAFIDAKSKLAVETKKYLKPIVSSMTPATPGVPVAPVMTESEINDMFWDNFQKTLEGAVTAKNALAAAAAANAAAAADEANANEVLPEPVPVLQTYGLKLAKSTDKIPPVDDPMFEEYMKAKANLVDVIGKMKTNIPTPPTPITAPYIPFFGPLAPLSYILPTSTGDSSVPMFPGAVYKDYGQNIASHFITSKADIAKSANAMKALYTPPEPVVEPQLVEIEPTAYALKMTGADPTSAAGSSFTPLLWKMQFNPFFSSAAPTPAGLVEDKVAENEAVAPTVPNPGLYWNQYGTSKASQAINTKFDMIPFFVNFVPVSVQEDVKPHIVQMKSKDKSVKSEEKPVMYTQPPKEVAETTAELVKNLGTKIDEGLLMVKDKASNVI